MIFVEKPTLNDTVDIRQILFYWIEKDEVEKYIKRIENEIKGKTEFNLQFWVAKEDDKVVGITGLCDPLPKILEFAKTKNPGELKILYLDPECRGKGIGKILLLHVEKEAVKNKYTEILIRSAKRFEDTAYGFYEKMGYLKVGVVSSIDSPETMQVFGKQLSSY